MWNDSPNPDGSPPLQDSVTAPQSTFSRVLHRPNYSRLESNDMSDETIPGGYEGNRGLGLQYRRSSEIVGGGSNRSSVARRPVGAHTRSSDALSGSTQYEGSVGKQATVTQAGWRPAGVVESPKSAPASVHALSPGLSSPGSPRGFEAVYESLDAPREDEDVRRPSLQSSRQYSTIGQQFSDTDGLRVNAAEPAASIRSRRSLYEDQFDPRSGCPAMVNFEHSRFNWYGVTIFTLSIFSTVFSGIYCVLATVAPRYGHTIGTKTKLTSSTASILTTLFAKLIELSFVTVFIAFVGQALSRRSFMQRHRGVSLAELSMRSWIMQPGSLISNPQSVRYAGFTILGGCCLLAALVALLYTTAAEALVSPQLKFSQWEDRMMQGPVLTTFGNALFLKDSCRTPITAAADPDGITTYGGTCNDISLAGEAYHNYRKYLSDWYDIAQAGNGTTDLATRPHGYALLNDNTTVTGAWVDRIDVPTASEKHGGRVINNVSLAMPHAGVSLAAYDSKNGILQPSQLDGLGIYNIRASAPSPMVNVLCANVNETDIQDIVYTGSQASQDKPLNVSQWPTGADFSDFNNFKFKTAVSDIFGWNNTDELHQNYPPFFYKFPEPYNTVFNGTGRYNKRNSVYVLGRGGPLQGNQMFLCALKATYHLKCSTNFTATASGATMFAHCDDPADDLSYRARLNNDTFPELVNPDWVDLAGEWGLSISLNDGINDANSSNARLLTELALAGPQLSTLLPSPAEALAVMAGSMLLGSSLYAPFVPFWNYTVPVLGQPTYQNFNASIRAQEYASGGVQPYQRAFFPILYAVFIINVALLAYFVFHKGMVTDYCEPANLFALAINSPPSELAAGSCGGGPEAEQYRVNWRIMNEHEHLYVTGELPGGWRTGKRAKLAVAGAATGYEMRPRSAQSTPVSLAYSKFSRRTTIL